MERTGKLMAVYKAKLSHAQGQLAVGMGLKLVDQHAAGAVHGLYRVILAVYYGGVHVVLVVIPVAAPVPQLLIENYRSGDFHIAVSLMHLAPVLEQGVAQHHALGEEEGEAGALLHEGEQAELLAQLAVVALLGLLDAGDVLLKVGLLFKSGAIYALKHLVLFAAAPVCACNAHELYEFYLAGVFNVGAGAQVGKVSLTVEAYYSVLGQILNKLYLIGLAFFFEVLYSVGSGHLEAFKGQRLGDYFFHLLLDLFEIFRSEGLRVKVIVETGVNSGADGQLCLGMYPLYGLGKYMGGCMAHGPAAVFIFPGEELNAVVA